jgi:tetratricopeptide (TPR) repeat protein
MKLRPLCFLWCALLLAQTPEALRHFKNGQGLFEEHDDSGEALLEAEREFQLALKADPNFAAAQAYLGLIALEAEHKEEARTVFEKALRMDANCAEARVGLAQLAIGRAQWKEAIELLRRAVSGAPRNSLALDGLAWALTAENQQPTDAMWREAMGYWRRLVGMDKNDRDSQHALAKAHVRFGEWKDAERGFREVLRIGQTPEDSDVWVYSVHGELANSLEKQGRFEEAIREYEKLVAAEGAGDQEIAEARERIAELRTMRKRR